MRSRPESRPDLLLTGFEPFHEFLVNPSWEAASFVAAKFPDRVVARQLPVAYHAAREGLIAALHEVHPRACLCMGLAPFAEFRLEQLARKPLQFADLPGESTLHGNWPWESVEAVLRERDIPHTRSTNAGQFVCESTYWTLLDHATRDGTDHPMGFLHVPAASELFPVERTMEIVLAIVERHLAGPA